MFTEIQFMANLSIGENDFRVEIFMILFVQGKFCSWVIFQFISQIPGISVTKDLQVRNTNKFKFTNKSNSNSFQIQIAFCKK